MASKQNIRIEHAILTFRNFAGAKKMYNDEGKRNFCVYLDGYDRKGNEFENRDLIPQYKYGPDWLGPNELIPALENDKWLVKWSKESEDGSYPSRPYLKVNINYNDKDSRFDPRVYLVKSNGDYTPIDKDTLHLLDTVWVANADIIIRPYNYEEKNGVENGKVSAQLKTIYITPVEDADEDEFDGKYQRGESEEMPW